MRLRTVILLGGMAFVFLALTPRIQGAPRTWMVIIGGESNNSAIASNLFYPREIDIAVGDTVTFKFEGNHNIAFTSGQPRPPRAITEGTKVYLNPVFWFRTGSDTYDGTGYRNSGPSAGDPKFTYSLTFTKAGTYEYVCLFHSRLPGISGTVNVRERVYNSPEATERRGRTEQAATLKAGQAAWATWEPERQGATVILSLIGDPKAGFSILRFSKQPIVVSVGTTVTWVNRDPFRPHTVTFLAGETPPPDGIVEPQPQGPPKLLSNPKRDLPTAHKTYDGTGFVHSGNFFGPALPPYPNTPSSYSLTFTRPGRYEYTCLFHDAEGMKGTVIVR